MSTTEKVTAKVTEQAEEKVQEMEAAKVAGAEGVDPLESLRVGKTSTAADRQIEDRDLEEDALLENEPDSSPEDDLSDMEGTNLFVFRRKFITKDKKNQYWGYHVSGTVRGRDVQVSLKASDAGGYEVIDIVFLGAKQVPLYRVPYTIKDNQGKVTMSGYRYYAVSMDEDGSVYTANLIPSRKSDGALLEMMIKNQARLVNKQSGGDRVASEG